MIYPRLKLKSEVFANILDGARTEFILENDEKYEINDAAEKRKIEREESRMKRLGGGDNKAFQQTCLNDFFFGNGQSSSSISTTVDSNSLNIVNVIEETKLSEPEEESEVIELMAPYKEPDFIDRPPTPPLAAVNILGLIDIE